MTGSHSATLRDGVYQGWTVESVSLPDRPSQPASRFILVVTPPHSDCDAVYRTHAGQPGYSEIMTAYQHGVVELERALAWVLQHVWDLPAIELPRPWVDVLAADPRQPRPATELQVGDLLVSMPRRVMPRPLKVERVEPSDDGLLIGVWLAGRPTQLLLQLDARDMLRLDKLAVKP